MGKIDVEEVMAGMQERLQQDEAEGRLAGLTVEDLRDAVSHPEAPGVITEVMELEAASVQEGDPAPDFSLARLGSNGEDESERMTLSEHCGKSPVALIFGSYT
jgi:hypothetical protein